MGAIAAAPELQRQLDCLHERRGAHHVVVIERPPAGVGVQMPEQLLGRQERRVLGQMLAIHQQVLPIHVDLDVVDPLRPQLMDHVQRHPHVAHQDLHRRLGVLVLQKQRHALVPAHLRRLPEPLDQPAPGVRVRRLEGIVVALSSGPDDEVGIQ